MWRGLFSVWNGAEDLSSKLIASAREEDPELELRRIALELARLKKEGGAWSIESRCSLVRFQIAVGALLSYLAEKSLLQITRDLRILGTELKKLNGRFDGEEFGPRVQSVFEALRES